MTGPRKINTMFSSIAKRYDLANRLLSGGKDVFWRQELVRAVYDVHPDVVLDLATGSGDVAFALADSLPSSTKIIGMDFCQAMLDEAKKKKQIRGGASKIVFRQGDGLALPLPDKCVDSVTISFGLRNMVDRHRALSEIRRVLRQGGHLFVLEFSQPFPWLSPVYYFYLKLILPAIAAPLTGNKPAYKYLADSITKFPTRQALSEEIFRAGLSMVTSRPLTAGIVALHQARNLI